MRCGGLTKQPRGDQSPRLLPTRTHLRGPGVRARFGPTDHPLRPLRHRLGAAPCGQRGGDASSPRFREQAGLIITRVRQLLTSPRALGAGTYRRGRGWRGAQAAALWWSPRSWACCESKPSPGAGFKGDGEGGMGRKAGGLALSSSLGPFSKRYVATKVRNGAPEVPGTKNNLNASYYL